MTASNSPQLENRAPNDYEMKSQTRLGLILTIAVIAFVFVWGGLAHVAGAVIAQGRITLESSLKRIQHREGGIVGAILVKEGDIVQTGQVLVRLDSTIVGATAETVAGQIEQLEARKLRLEAERDGVATILETGGGSPILQAEQKLLTSRLTLGAQRRAQLKDQIRQAGAEIAGYQAQISATRQQAYFAKRELSGVREVFEKGYGSFTRISDLERQVAQLDGQVGQLTAAIAKSRAQISQLEEALTQVDAEVLTDVMGQLKDTESRLSELRQQRVTSDDAQSRLEITSPVSGKVQQLAFHTKGGVIGPGETIMLVVPERDELIVEANIDPTHIDSVVEGGVAHLRFVTFNSQTTPEAEARVDRVSRDIETDQRTGQSYYRARLKLNATVLPPSLRQKLQPGQPVEVHVATSNRSALSYFLKPLTDQIMRAFREE
jgi:HlyD family secretion protein